MKRLTAVWGLGVFLCACAVNDDGARREATEEVVYEPAIVRLEPRPSQQTMPEMSRLTKAVATVLEQRHYRPRAIDDTLSGEVYDALMSALDPGHFFLMQSDHDELRKYREHLDDEIKQDQLAFPWIAAELVSRRAEEFLIFARALLESGPDCGTGQSFLANRAAAKPPANEEEQHDLWSAFVKNELIRIRVIRHVTADTSLHFNGVKLEEPFLAAMSETERVMLRLQQYTNAVRYPPQRAAAQQFLTSLAQAFDPHCVYNAPKDFTRRMAGLNLAFAGIGVVYNNEEAIPRVMEIVPNGPVAQQGGLEAGDFLVGVSEMGGTPVSLLGLPPNAVSDLIRGPKGTPVIFNVANGAYPDSPYRTVIIKRDDITHQPASASAVRREIVLDNGRRAQIGVIKLPIFYIKPADTAGKPRGASDEIRNLIADFTAHGTLDGVILDLRDNPGGYLPEALRVANLFLDRGPVVQVKSRETVTPMVSPDTDAFYRGPLIVLVNRHSASASEIVAGVIKDYGRGIIVGDESTFGKGTVQQVIDMTQYSQRLALPDPAGGLSLTTSMFFRVSGESTQIEGVPSDILVPGVANNASVGERYLKGTLPYSAIPAIPREIVDSALVMMIPALADSSRRRVEVEPALNPHLPKTENVDTSPVPLPLYIVIDYEKRLSETIANCRKSQDAQRKKRTSPATSNAEKTLPPRSTDAVLEETLSIFADYLVLTL